MRRHVEIFPILLILAAAGPAAAQTARQVQGIAPVPSVSTMELQSQIAKLQQQVSALQQQVAKLGNPVTTQLQTMQCAYADQHILSCKNGPAANVTFYGSLSNLAPSK